MAALCLEHKYKLTQKHTKTVVLELYTVFPLDGSWNKNDWKKKKRRII